MVEPLEPAAPAAGDLRRVGCAHAKVALLWSKDRVLLAVGSGNLTWAGMQSNLEAWEVLVGGTGTGLPEERRLTAGLAADVRTWLGALELRAPQQGRAQLALQQAGSQLESWALRLPQTGAAVRWFDSTDSTLASQLVKALPPPTGRRTLRVLSPFFDKTGQAVVRLARALSADRVEILATRSRADGRAVTAWPGRAQDADLQVELRVLDDPAAAGRPLHAKLFHIMDEGGRGWIATGSANATHRALWTQDNLEVLLLRELTADQSTTMLPAIAGPVEQQPALAPDERETSPAVLQLRSVRATDTRLVIELSWNAVEVPIRAMVRLVGEDAAAHVVPWTPPLLDLPLPAALQRTRREPVRLELIAETAEGTHRAVAWVHLDSVLGMAGAQRAAMWAWARLVRRKPGSELDDDDHRLLAILAEEHSRLLDYWTPRSRHLSDAAESHSVERPAAARQLQFALSDN